MSKSTPAWKVVKRHPDGRLRATFGLDDLKALKSSSGRYTYEILRYDAEAGVYRPAQLVTFGHKPTHVN